LRAIGIGLCQSYGGLRSSEVKVGGATTVSAIVVVSVSVPEVPVMVTVTGPPTVAVLEAVKVSTLVLAVVGWAEAGGHAAGLPAG